MADVAFASGEHRAARVVATRWRARSACAARRENGTCFPGAGKKAGKWKNGMRSSKGRLLRRHTEEYSLERGPYPCSQGILKVRRGGMKTAETQRRREEYGVAGAPGALASLRLCGSTTFSLVQGKKQGSGKKRSKQIQDYPSFDVMARECGPPR